MSDRDPDDRDEYDDYDEPTERVATRTDEHRNPAERGKWVSLLVALLGVWLIVEPIVFEITAANFWNDVIVGGALILLGGYNYYRRADERFGSVSVGAFVALIGLWLIAAPFVLDPNGLAAGSDAAFWNDIVVGGLTLLLGAYSAYEASQSTEAATPART